MELKEIIIGALRREDVLKKVTEEAYQYGINRGGASAIGDKYGLLGGPKFDSVLKDYLSAKFGISKSIRAILEQRNKIPKKIFDKLEEGFKKGYSKNGIELSCEDDLL